MAGDVMAAWCAEHRFVGPARLDGFSLRFLRRSVRWQAGAADVVPADGHTTWGALYEVSAADLDALDAKEFAAAGGYRRRAVEVTTAEHQRLEAVTYEVVDKEPEELAPTKEYLALLQRGARERGLPAEWMAHLEELLRRFGARSR